MQGFQPKGCNYSATLCNRSFSREKICLVTFLFKKELTKDHTLNFFSFLENRSIFGIIKQTVPIC